MLVNKICLCQLRGMNFHRSFFFSDFGKHLFGRPKSVHIFRLNCDANRKGR